MVSGDLSEEIHEENIEKLSKMTETDILEKQNEIKSMLNPKLIEFIKNRKSTGNTLLPVTTFLVTFFWWKPRLFHLFMNCGP